MFVVSLITTQSRQLDYAFFYFLTEEGCGQALGGCLATQANQGDQYSGLLSTNNQPQVHLVTH